jgi:hypothetical protein
MRDMAKEKSRAPSKSCIPVRWVHFIKTECRATGSHRIHLMPPGVPSYLRYGENWSRAPPVHSNQHQSCQCANPVPPCFHLAPVPFMCQSYIIRSFLPVAASSLKLLLVCVPASSPCSQFLKCSTLPFPRASPPEAASVGNVLLFQWLTLTLYLYI